MKALALIAMVLTASAHGADKAHEDLGMVFDRHKGRIYALYRQALNDNPRLAGKIVYDIDIARTGDITGCRVRSSTVESPALEAKICASILQWKLPPQAAATTITKPVSFYPTM